MELSTHGSFTVALNYQSGCQGGMSTHFVVQAMKKRVSPSTTLSLMSPKCSGGVDSLTPGW